MSVGPWVSLTARGLPSGCQRPLGACRTAQADGWLGPDGECSANRVATSSRRLWAPVLSKIALRWSWTVVSAMNRPVAISRVDAPRATSPVIWPSWRGEPIGGHQQRGHLQGACLLDDDRDLVGFLQRHPGGVQDHPPPGAGPYPHPGKRRRWWAGGRQCAQAQRDRTQRRRGRQTGRRWWELLQPPAPGWGHPDDGQVGSQHDDAGGAARSLEVERGGAQQPCADGFPQVGGELLHQPRLARRERWRVQLPVQAHHSPAVAPDPQGGAQLIAEADWLQDLPVASAAPKRPPGRLGKGPHPLAGPCHLGELVDVVVEELVGHKQGAVCSGSWTWPPPVNSRVVGSVVAQKAASNPTSRPSRGSTSAHSRSGSRPTWHSLTIAWVGARRPAHAASPPPGDLPTSHQYGRRSLHKTSQLSGIVHGPRTT
jgi:hypothetical protein